VALIVIMLFISARETSSLRERAEDAEDRVQRLEYALEQVSRTAAQAAQAAQATQAAEQARARPTPAPAVAARAAAAPAVAARPGLIPAPAPASAAIAQGSRLIPSAPFGTGAPALSSATRLIPADDVQRAGARAPNGSPASATPAPAIPAPAPATAAAGQTALPALSELSAPSAPSAPTAPAPTAARATAPVADPPASWTAPGQSGTRAPRTNYGRPAESKSRIGKGSIAAALVLVAVIVVVAVLVLHHHNSPSRVASTGTHTSTTKHGKGKHGRVVRVDPRNVTVAVLNGTSTTNLAADISSQLNKVGFQPGATANYSNQTQTSTKVTYLPGHRAQGLAVAKALKLNSRDVKQVNASTRELACGSTTNCPDQVIVVVGTDLESDA
jgi:hypothetical protein